MLSGGDHLFDTLAARLHWTEEAGRQHAAAQRLVEAAVLTVKRNMGGFGLEHLVLRVTGVCIRHTLDVLEQPVDAKVLRLQKHPGT